VVNTEQTPQSEERTRVAGPIPTIEPLGHRSFASRRRNLGPWGGSDMSLIGLVLILVVVGVLLWLLNNYVPMDAKIKRIVNVVVVIVVIIWLLQAFGLLGSLQNIRIR
jgi:hypothetical protein